MRLINIRRFPNPKENPQKFTEDFRILIGVFDLELSDLYQFIICYWGCSEA
jgi:hypothetical protein